jgi:hypothetical protein
MLTDATPGSLQVSWRGGRQAEFLGDPREVVLLKLRRSGHQRHVGLPELAVLRGKLCKHGCLGRQLVPRQGAVPECVHEAIAELVEEPDDALVRRTTILACVAAVLDERDRRVGLAEDVIAGAVDGWIEQLAGSGDRQCGILHGALRHERFGRSKAPAAVSWPLLHKNAMNEKSHQHYKKIRNHSV